MHGESNGALWPIQANLLWTASLVGELSMVLPTQGDALLEKVRKQKKGIPKRARETTRRRYWQIMGCS